ncbi:MAG: hypothetical protein JO324_04715 [Candidatus Eremiobacteraeota bacterium]|nr:hypothetical protein [Candidatus Eremiobacteraeota bacterium]
MKTSLALAAGVAAFAVLAACSTGTLPGGARNGSAVRADASGAALPRELLYVTGGAPTTRHPYIEVFNAQDTSPTPAPLYTIAPTGDGVYGPFSVDAANNLYAMNYYQNGAVLLVFPSGTTKAAVKCLLDTMPSNIYLANYTLYVSTRAYTIEEYSLPIRAGRNCPKPARVLTDLRAKLRGAGLFAVAVDAQGNVFDVWSPGANYEIDVFPLGSKNARQYVKLPQSSGDAMLSDAAGNLITNVGHAGRNTNAIAVFPYRSRDPNIFDTIAQGRYFGFALGDDDTELFAMRNYPAVEVGVWSYDPRGAQVGRKLHSLTNIYPNSGSIAVFSKK